MTHRLLVFGDSLCFHGPDRAYPADEPRIWPNLAAARLGGTAAVVARIGWTARDAWWALTDDPRVWADLREVDAVVLAVGNMDAMPSPLPTYLRTGLRHLRPEPLRRVVRRAYLGAQPRLAVLMRGRPVALPPALTVQYLDRCVGALRAVRPELPIVGVTPPLHRAASYGGVYSGRHATGRAIRQWASESGVGLVDLAQVVGDHVMNGDGNPDGMHWGWSGHRMVADAMVEALPRPLR